MTKIVLSGYFEIPAADLAAVREGLPGHIAASLAEEGCLLFEASEDPNHAGRFNVYEEFANQGALDQHKARTQASPWSQLCTNADRHFEIKEVPSE